MSPLGDFIMEFFGYTQEFMRDTPDLFRRWCGISLVASALERRVWVPIGGYVVYPNLYTILVAPSGFGKAIIEYSKRLLEGVKDPQTAKPMFRVQPDNMTKASMIDEIAKAEITRIKPQGMGGPLIYHALNIYSEDLNAWMSTYDAETFGALLAIWNNQDDYKETRRTSIVRSQNIKAPIINLLVGVQPFIMGSMFPDEAWYTGLTRRTIMVYSYEQGPKRRLSEFIQPDPTHRAELQQRLAEFGQLFGQCDWTPDALVRLVEWDFADGPPRPQHTRLDAYCKSRTIFAEKLAVVSAVSRTGALLIEEVDVVRAIEWLLDAERTMPDIFRAMKGKSDGAVLEELWRFAQGEFIRRKGGIPRQVLWHWLSGRTPSDKLPKIFDLAEQADFIRRMPAPAVDLFVPGSHIPGES